VVLRFLRATNAGWRTAVAHPHATAEMIVARYMPDSSVVDEEASLRKSIPLLNYETHDDRLGLMAKSTWDETIAMFNTYQLVGHSVSADNLVDYSILRKLYPAP
jgi:ABC-type nitrate/sulfonate/bicarbonate transport system substrate-binding protein